MDYIRHSRFWMNFALNKHQKLWFLVCATRGYTFCGMRGYGIISQRMIFQWNTCMTTIWYKIHLITFGVYLMQNSLKKTTMSDVIRGTFKFDNFYFNKYICSYVKLCSSMYFRYFVIIFPRKKRRGPSFEQTWIPITQACFVPSFVEIGPVIHEKMKMWKVYDNDDGQRTNYFATVIVVH